MEIQFCTEPRLPSYNPFDFVAAASVRLNLNPSTRLQVATALHHSDAHFRTEHTFRLTPKVSLLFIRHYEDWAETNVCRIGQEGQPKLKESVSTSILDDGPSYSLNFGSPLDFGVSLRQ